MDFTDWLRQWRSGVEARFDLISGPQLIEGCAEFIIAGSPLNPPTGRASCVKSGDWHERWAITNPANARNASSALIQAIPPLNPDPTIDWMTSPLLYQGLAAPVRDAKDAFVYVTPVPTIPPLPAPPPCDETRKYKVFNVAPAGPPSNAAPCTARSSTPAARTPGGTTTGSCGRATRRPPSAA